ncbi:Ran-binding protein M-like protein [Drosera capensis]
MNPNPNPNPNPYQSQIGQYFLNQAKLNSNPTQIDSSDPSPTELNTINSSGGFLVVSTDKLSVKYAGVNLHGHDVGVVQADRPAPMKRLAYYFEMSVKCAGVKGQVAIGLSGPGFKMRRQPGWEVNSYGYHGDDGLLYRGQGKGEPFGPTYTTGDTVGCGINYAVGATFSPLIFFTKNGAIVGSLYKDVKGPLYPTVAVHSPNEEVVVNFGKDPFVFDIKAYKAQERVKQQELVETVCLSEHVDYGMIRTYLLHYGYEETLNSFDMANRNSVPPISVPQVGHEPEILYSLGHRKTLRQDNNSAACFLLHCQKFIELVRLGELEEAIKYGRDEFTRYNDVADFEVLLKDTVALLAYEDPQKSPVRYLLQDSQREVVADTLNAMILSANPSIKDKRNWLHSYLEKVLRQLTACCLEIRSFNGGQGEAFDLHRVLSAGKNEQG